MRPLALAASFFGRRRGSLPMRSEGGEGSLFLSLLCFPLSPLSPF